VCGPSAAKAQDTAQWTKVGNWSVGIGLQPFAALKECFLLTSTEDGSSFRLGFAWKGVYILLANDAWQSLRTGGEYELHMTFGRTAPSPINAQVLAFKNKRKALLVRFDEQSALQFIRQFSSQSEVVFSYKGRTVTSIPLSKGREAAQAMFDCMERFAPTAR
jgi:hypothetical protein